MAVLLCLVSGGLLLCRPAATNAATGINQEINYQARLLNAQGATVPDGSYNIQFKIYKNGDGTLAGDTGGSGGTLLWTESWQNSNSQGITVTNGYLSVQLGAICALSGGSCQGNTNTGVDFNQSVLWLSVNIGGTSSGASPTYDGEMLPMRQLAAAPYALNANELGGLTATQFLQLAPNSVQTDSSTNSSIFVNKTGSSGLLLELQSGGTDEATISKTGVLTLASTGGLTIGATSVCDSTGSTGCIAKSGSGYYIHNYQTTPTLQTAAGFDIQGPSGQVTAIVEANGADSLDLQNSSGVNVVTFGSTGSVLLKTSTNATNAFQIQDSSANSVLRADTTNDRVGIGTNVPLNTFGTSPLQYNTGTASQSGTAITGSGTTWTSAMVGDQIVFANGVSETITAFGSTTSLTASVSQTVSSQAYKLFYPGLQVSSTGNIGINQLSPSALLDVAQNSAQTTAPMQLIEQNGTGDATLQFSNATNSNSFYLGQDASNGGSFRINSSTSSVTPLSPTAPALVQAAQSGLSGGAGTINKAFNSNVTSGNAIIVTFGWDFGAGITATQCQDQNNNTYTMVPITESDATATQSFGVCYATNVVGGNTDNVTVTFNNGSTTFRTIIIQEYSGIAATNALDTYTGQDVATGTVATDGVTSGSLNTSQNNELLYGVTEDMNSTPNATISAGTGFNSVANQTSSNVNVMDEDKAIASPGPTAATFTFSAAHRYAAMAVVFRPATSALSDTYGNAVFTLGQGGSATFQTTQDSTTGFVLQNNNGVALLTGDTINARIYVGPTAGNTAGSLLVLGNKTTSGDPTGVAGAMYYNSNTGNFRCFQGGVWINCIGSAFVSTATTTVNNCTTACGALITVTSGWPANYCSAGHVYHLFASGQYSTTATPTLTIGTYLGTSSSLASDTLLGGAGSSNSPTLGTVTAAAWNLDVYIACNSTTSVFVHGNMNLVSNGSTGSSQTIQISASGATTITNTAQNFYIFPTWGTASTSNTITSSQVIFQSL